MQTGFYTNKENLIKFLKWVKENIKDAVIIDSKLNGDDVIDLIEKDILTWGKILVFDKDCEIFKADIKDEDRIHDLSRQNSISVDFYLCDDSAYSFDFTNYSFYSKTNTKKYPESRIYADGYYSKEETGKRNQIYNKMASFIKRNSKKYKYYNWNEYVLEIKEKPRKRKIKED
ncbi:MAG TPA: hypothetical protein DHU62_03965 [Firmicutes bacterium]|nr:hypothetical protein [Bacillota bacterium]